MLRQSEGQKKACDVEVEAGLVITESVHGGITCTSTGCPVSEESSGVGETSKLSPGIRLDSRPLVCPPCPDLHSCLSAPSLAVYCSTCTNTDTIFSHDAIRSTLMTSCTMPLTFSAPNLTDLMMLSSSTLSPNMLISQHQDLHHASPVQVEEMEKDSGVPGQHGFYECRWMQCGQKFYNMEDLVVHVNDYHVKVERPDVDYQCKWTGCPRLGKGFNARYKMLIHIRTHTNEKPHRCNICGKCFSRLENLKIHNRSHTGEKPYVCPFEGCQKAYSNSSDRFKHVRTHQEEKPYICKMPGCNKRYTDPSSLRKHVRTHGHYYRAENEQFVSRAVKSAQQSLSNIINLSQNGILLNSQSQHMIPLQNPLLPSLQAVSTPLIAMPTVNSAVSMMTSQVTELLPRTVTSLPVSVVKVESADVCNMCSSVIHSNDEVSQDAPLDLSRSPVHHPHSPDSNLGTVHHPPSPDSNLRLQNTTQMCANDLQTKRSPDLKNGLLLDLTNHSISDPAKTSFSTLTCSSVLLSSHPVSKSVSLDLSSCLLPHSMQSKTYRMDID